MMCFVSGVNGTCREMTSLLAASVRGVHVLDAVLGGPVAIRKRIVGQHLHAEAAQDLGDDAADLAGADDAGGLAVQVEADQAVEREVQFADAVEGAVNLAIERQQQRDGVLGHGVGRIDRHARDGELQLLGGGEIHVVESGAAQRHELHALSREGLQAGPVQLVVDEDADGLRALRRGRGFLRQAELQETPLDAALGRSALELLAVVRPDPSTASISAPWAISSFTISAPARGGDMQRRPALTGFRVDFGAAGEEQFDRLLVPGHDDVAGTSLPRRLPAKASRRWPF